MSGMMNHPTRRITLEHLNLTRSEEDQAIEYILRNRNARLSAVRRRLVYDDKRDEQPRSAAAISARNTTTIAWKAIFAGAVTAIVTIIIQYLTGYTGNLIFSINCLIHCKFNVRINQLNFIGTR